MFESGGRIIRENGEKFVQVSRVAIHADSAALPDAGITRPPDSLIFSLRRALRSNLVLDRAIDLERWKQERPRRIERIGITAFDHRDRSVFIEAVQ